MNKKIPMRTCIVCRKSLPKKELYRIVKSGEEIFLDKTGKANGRGAYVCSDQECFKKLKKGKMLNKAFSMEVKEEVYDKLLEALIGE
ncbi:MAG: YlxR family protein [Clostridia bacterium]|nr:YlxR family protein [Clostridia bacterium]